MVTPDSSQGPENVCICRRAARRISSEACIVGLARTRFDSEPRKTMTLTVTYKIWTRSSRHRAEIAQRPNVQGSRSRSACACSARRARSPRSSNRSARWIPRRAARRGREDQRSEGSTDRGARRASRRARSGEARGAARERCRRRHVARPRPDDRRPASGHARASSHRADLPQRRLHDRRRSGDRRRLAQLRSAEHSRRIIRRARCTTLSIFRDGRLLRTHTSPVQVRCDGGAETADARDRAGSRLSQRLGHDAHADVPPGRRPGRRRGHHASRT